MLSYRHAFHAGNHADVLKHLVQTLILEYLVKKPGKPLRYIDTHAGPGSYSLTGAYAGKTNESEQGIARLYARDDLPEPLSRYVQLVRGYNHVDELKRYPGSPAIARSLLGHSHKMQLYELHPADFKTLKQWSLSSRRISAEQQDGFARLPKSLPPPERRALVLIDPPYEVKRDYRTLVASLDKAVQQFTTGVYLVWYPLLTREEVGIMLKALRAKPWRWLNAELKVRAESEGMYGSGVFVVNPPWHLAEQLQTSLAVLQQLLAQDETASSALLSNGLD